MSSRSEVSIPGPGFRLGLNDGALGLLATAILLFAAVFWSAYGLNTEKTDFSLTYVGARLVSIRARFFLSILLSKRCCSLPSQRFPFGSHF